MCVCVCARCQAGSTKLLWQLNVKDAAHVLLTVGAQRRQKNPQKSPPLFASTLKHKSTFVFSFVRKGQVKGEGRAQRKYPGAGRKTGVSNEVLSLFCTEIEKFYTSPPARNEMSLHLILWFLVAHVCTSLVSSP